MVSCATRGGTGSARERSAPGGRSPSAAVTRGTLPMMTQDGEAEDAMSASSVVPACACCVGGGAPRCWG
jgi:hypothetical protein